MDALKVATGSVQLNIQWTRIPYTSAVAENFRVGNPETEGTRNLINQPFKKYRVVYKYFRPDDCIFRDNHCVRAFGWRRLLTFTTTAVNVAKQRYLNIARLGDNGNNTLFVKKGVYQWDQCIRDFKHISFVNYDMDAVHLGSPLVTCIHDSYRYAAVDRSAFALHLLKLFTHLLKLLSLLLISYQNHEYSPMTTHYDTCKWQGISSGWGFDLTAGTSCQWLDITRKLPGTLTSTINPAGYLCEGVPQLTKDRPIAPVFPPIETGTSISGVRPICNYSTQYMDDNHFQAKLIRFPRASVVSRPCASAQKQLGFHRDCGWTVIHEARRCKPGALVTISVAHQGLRAFPIGVRICDVSRNLGFISTRCEYVDGLASALVRPNDPTKIVFMCPDKRDDQEKGGFYSVMVSKFVPWETQLTYRTILVKDL